MVRNKLNLLKQEIEHYIGLPYSKNILKDGKVIERQILDGKGNWLDIKKETETIAQREQIDLSKLNKQELYNFQKKYHIGIDCSGLACQLLNFHFKANLNPLQTSAHMLTSNPISKEITNLNDLKTGDLVRQRNGLHVLFIINKKGNIIDYVESSFWGRGVQYGQANLTDKSFIHQGFFRLLFLD
jgi:hypothetical protein